jgi:hypothetical protein
LQRIFENHLIKSTHLILTKISKKMKKVSLLIAMIAFAFGNLVAQTTVLSESFEAYTVGNGLMTEAAAAGNDWWESWPQTPPATEPLISSDFASDGVKSVKLFYGNDAVLLLGDKENGVYTLSFDMYIPNGKDAYNNVLHAYAGSGSEWATEVYYKHSSNGTSIKAGGTNYNFECPYDAWFNVKYDIDLDNDQATFSIDGEVVCTWQYSQQASGDAGTRKLAAMDFYPPTSAAVSEYYVDNIDVSMQSNSEVLVVEPFEEYTVGNGLVSEAVAAGHDWWELWPSNPPATEPIISNEFASEGTQSAKMFYGNDAVLLLGDQTSGTFTCSFDMYIPNGKDAYNNVLHIFNGSGSEWATEVYYKHSSNGTSIKAGGVTTNFECPYDTWFNVKYDLDLDNDQATFFVDNVEIVSWQFSLQAGGEAGSRQLAAMDFYPPTSAAVSEYYVDNILIEKVGGTATPHLTINPTSVTQDLAEDDMTTVDITIENTGNSIGDWNGWLEFGQGGAGSQSAELYYHNGNTASGHNIGSSGAVTRELAIRLPAVAYAGAAMGMRIVSANYYINGSNQATDHNYTFHVYGQGANGQPGELLAEKTVYSEEASTWITAEFDEAVYLTGQAMWIGVQLEQGADQYPLSMDDGEYGEEQDGNWLSSNGGTFSHCYLAGDDGFQGAWFLTANCQGELIPATWASINKTEGAVHSGETETITLSLNSIGLAMGTDYHANLIINTNDEALPHIEIPVTLAVTDGVVENNGVELASIYPNPAISQVTLEGENLNSVAIYNVAGQLVRVVKLDNMVNNIEMNVEAGVYFFSIYDNNGNSNVQRVVITK